MSSLDAVIASLAPDPTSTKLPNPSHQWTKAQELASVISHGPSLSSQEVGKVLVPIEQLCGPNQPPVVQAAGYEVIKALCGGSQESGQVANAVLKPLERRQIWEAMCRAGPDWHRESSTARLDALDALLGLGDTAIKSANSKANVEDLTGVVGEMRRWLSNAVEGILSLQERARDGQTIQDEDREAFITRLDGIFHQVMKHSPHLITEKETRITIEMYSTWSDRAVKDEYDHLHPISNVVSQTVKPNRFQGRNPIATTPTTFTFPSSMVTPMEPTLSLSRAQSSNIPSTPQSQSTTTPTPAYLLLGPLFLNLIHRFHTNSILVPIDSFPRIMTSISFLIALSIKVLPTSGMWVAGISPGPDPYEKDRGSIDSTAHLMQPPTRNVYTGGLATPKSHLRSANPQYPIMAAYDEGYSEGNNAQDETKAKDMARLAKVLVNALINDQWYSSSALQAVKQLLLPTSSKSTGPVQKYIIGPYAAQGAARALRYCIVKALKTELARAALNDIVANSYAMGGAPSLLDDIVRYENSWNRVGLGMSFEKIGSGLKEAVATWRVKGIDAGDSNGLGGEIVLMEFSGLVMDILTLCPKGAVGEVPTFAGELLQELAEVIKEYRSTDNYNHRLRLGTISNSLGTLLSYVAGLLRLPLDTIVVRPSLSSILLSLSDHLNDNDALTLVTHMTSSSELSPSFPDWSSNFRRLINAFCTNARSYPKARKALAVQLAKVYADITDIDQEALRAEIVEDMVGMWERTLFEEKDEDILNAAFDIMSREIVLATMADDDSGDDEVQTGAIKWADIAQRIRAIWMKVAVTSPPYYESDKLASLHSPPPTSTGVHSASIVSTPSAEPNQHKVLHSPAPSLPINSLSAALNAATSSNTSLDELSEYPTSTPIATEHTQQGNATTSHPPRLGRAVLAAVFLIKAFNKLAFRSPQSLKVLLSDAPIPQYASAASMAITLFRDIVQLVGTNKPNSNPVGESGEIGKESGNEASEKLDRIQCPKARIVILQWLLRLRADRNHRIYGVGEIESEVLPLARVVYRAERPKVQSPRPSSERPGRDLPSGVLERRRNRAETRGAMELRVHRPIEREKERDGNSREHTREPRGRGSTEPASTSASRSRSRPPTSPQTPYTAPRPQEVLWSLPQQLTVELEKHAMRPSPAMATFASIKGEEGAFWLHVDYYVQTLADLLEFETDWEVVSYVLCHLPLQLSNKHFFCGPKTKIQIRRLVLVVCNAINGDRLCSQLDILLPYELTPVDVQALLYHTLTVLISYHRAFDPSVGEYDQNAKSIKADIVEVIYGGLAKDEATNKPCLEALALAVYELPDQVAKFTAPIIEKLSRIMSNPNMAVHILELLVIIGYTPRLYSGSFREEEYKRVFGVALLYIEHHYRPDATKLRTSDGRDSYSLAQHVLNTAFLVIYIWFLAIKLDDRVRYVPFISKQLIIANNRKPALEPSTEVCFDWLSRYAYSNADPKSAPSFLYRSIVAPGSGTFDVNMNWDKQHNIEMENISGIKAWKLGNSIVTITTMKKPPGWIRIVSRRPSGLTELVCRLENWPHVSPGDFAPDLISMPATMLADRPVTFDEGASFGEGSSFEEGDDLLDVDENMLNDLINDIINQSDVIQDIERPDPISGYVWSGVAPSQRRKDVTVDPSYIALVLSPYPGGKMVPPSRFKDYSTIKDILRVIDHTPVIDTHKVGVLYVAPGQTTEAEILANQHGSPAYTRFLAELGRVIKPSNKLEVYTGGLRPETHGEYAYAWWDDMSQIIYHVATVMPNIADCLYKKQEIGNDGVKIVWNDGGTPFRFDTIATEYALVNVVVEPHSVGARGAFSDNRHESEFFKVSLQTAPALPRITPIGEFKIISAEKLSMALRHFTLLASLFTKAWEGTGMDGEKCYPLTTNWQQRLRYINNSESKLGPKPSEDNQDQRSDRETSRDFTMSY